MTLPTLENLDWTVEFSIEDFPDEVIRLPVESELLIGRVSPDQTVFNGLDLSAFQASEFGVSRRHALIRWQGSHLVVNDLHSNNGTLLNGTKLQPEIDYRLNDGDSLFIGHLHMKVRVNQDMGPTTIRARRFEFNTQNVPMMGRGQQVMVVEDDSIFSQLYKATLEKVGFKVQTFPEVVSALRALNHSTPALILLDLRLVGVHGLELCRYVRRDTDFPSIPIVVVSGTTSDQSVQQTMEAGADVYMTKPINIKELIRVVNGLIYKSETENPKSGTKQLKATTPIDKPASTSRSNTAILFVEGAREPITLAVETQVTLGRHLTAGTRSQNHVDLDSYGAFDKGVSRVHARIRREQESFWIEDLGSSNGTFVEGQLVPPTEQHSITNGQEVCLGSLRMNVYLLSDKE
jgi:DNA-binding response OmpR family regulator